MAEWFRRTVDRLLRRDSKPDAPVVLGVEMARAAAADRAWREEHPDDPLGASYERWRGEFDLLRFVPSDTDRIVGSVVRSYRESPPEDPSQLRDGFGMEDCYTLLAFARRCAVRSLRSADPGIAADGLGAVAMVDPDRVDRRDVTPPVVLLHHALVRSGGDPAAVFGEMAPLAAAGVTDLIARFPTWPEDDRRLSAWGYREVATDAGPGFMYWDSAPWDPAMDLIGAALDVAGAIDADAYRVSAITAASDAPGVWFATPADRFGEVLERTRAGIRISADMKPGVADDAEEQQFTVFLIEAADEADSRQLAAWAVGTVGIERAVLAVASGPVLAVLVARSTLQGVPAHETDASLARFETPFREALERAGTTGPEAHPLVS